MMRVTSLYNIAIHQISRLQGDQGRDREAITRMDYMCREYLTNYPEVRRRWSPILFYEDVEFLRGVTANDLFGDRVDMILPLEELLAETVAGLHIRLTSTLVQHALMDTSGWTTL
ncbi:unnamed protein product [Phytophthora fragariaefolia]|uniref:Unnamed protein product n=1 Tax=Phytophthora fragariaefolia TaxID=1490495 RepID=A0A9W7D1Q4_9STRA|nr:unnamed protein product [Phytophthora fragariaefolia]